jgi:hypothetical protein
MINATPDEPDDRSVDRIVREGPGGAVVLAGIATFIVIALWLAFYLFVFSPRVLP